jgi:predicted DNA-binding helix-hairpin-helix protein
MMDIWIAPQMSVMDKLKILADAAKYDVSCSSSGSSRKNDGTGLGNTVAAGLCHSFGADGRCISLLKILFTNVFMTADIVSTDIPMTYHGPRLHRMKYVN